MGFDYGDDVNMKNWDDKGFETREKLRMKNRKTSRSHYMVVGGAGFRDGNTVHSSNWGNTTNWTNTNLGNT